jgi:hypothetical protein
MPIIKRNVQIHSLEQWKALAGPKSSVQWADGRSAKEVARAWLECRDADLPPEIAELITTHTAFGRVCQWTAEPEAKLCFDEFDGEPRNSDLLVEAADQYGSFLIAVEAKADEPFGDLLGDALAAAVERHLKNERSNGLARIQQLAHALFGPRQEGDPPLKHIRYQLMTACAGAMCKADLPGKTGGVIGRVILLIHEFVTDRTCDEKHDKNRRDLNNFVARLTHGWVKSAEAGHLYGPITLPGEPLFSDKAKLFIGKVTRNLRNSAPLTLGMLFLS